MRNADAGRARLRGCALALALLAMLAAAGAANALGRCGSGCTTIPGANVVKISSRHGLPYVVLKNVGRRPPAGTYVFVTPGPRDPAGFAGDVLGVGMRNGLTAIVAVPPFPGPEQINAATATGTLPVNASKNLLDLLPKPAQDWLEKNLLDLQCSRGIDFPLQVTRLALDPTRFNMIGPITGGLNPGGFVLSGVMTPSMTLKALFKGKLSCEATRTLSDLQVPPGAATFFLGPVPYIVTTSLQISAEAALEGSADAQVDVGSGLNAGLTNSGAGLQWSPAPTFSPFANVGPNPKAHADGTVAIAVKSVTRALVGRLWGPRMTLSFGPKVEFKGASTSAEGDCAELSWPVSLSFGLSFNPGFGFASGAAGDKLAELAQLAGATLSQAQVATILRNLSPGNINVNLSAEVKNLWRLSKAFETSDLVAFTAPLFTQALALGQFGGACAQLKVQGMDPTLKCSSHAQGCVHGPPASFPCTTQPNWSQFQVSADGLQPNEPYTLTLGGTAHGVTESRALGTITANADGVVSAQLFTLPAIPAHDPWTLTATPQNGGPPVTTTLETGEIDCLLMSAGGGAFVSTVGAVGLAPNSTFKEIVDGATAGTLQADANGTVPPTQVNGTCQTGQVNVLLTGYWLDHGQFTDDATAQVNQYC